jgi:hypothetical protein
VRTIRNTKIYSVGKMQSSLISFLYIKIVVFWVVTLCSIAGGHQRFGGICRLHLQGGSDEYAVRFAKSLSASRQGRGDASGKYIILELFFLSELKLREDIRQEDEREIFDHWSLKRTNCDNDDRGNAIPVTGRGGP